MSLLGILFDKDVSRRRRLLALLNILGVAYFFLMITTVTYLTLFEAVPLAAVRTHSPQQLHTCLIIFLFVNTLGNWINVYSTDSSLRTIPYEELRELRRDWKRACSSCKTRVPHRCHHCVICDRCILKRDHHCFFTGACIGYHNQKYFVMFCIYMFIAGLYATVLLAIHLHLSYGVQFASPLTLLTLVPHTLSDWLLGTVANGQLMLLGVFYGTFISGLGAGGFVFWQLYIIFLGQTTYEARHGIDEYSLSVKENFIDVFGDYWYISVLLPLPFSMSSNGIYVDSYMDIETDESSVAKTNAKRVRTSSISGSGMRRLSATCLPVSGLRRIPSASKIHGNSPARRKKMLMNAKHLTMPFQ